MTRPQSEHALRVVERFKEMLSPSGRQHVGERHFHELALLIESAMSSAILEEMEGFADRLDEVARDVRRRAENYDSE